MIQDEKTKRLRKFLEKVSPGIYDSRATALESMSTSDQKMTGLESGLEKLASRQPLSLSESAGLEAIIHRKYRPAAFIINNKVEDLPDPWTHFGKGTLKANIKHAIRCIGRIELPAETGIPYGGTGFVVGPGLIMTNRHVAEIFARGLGTRNVRYKTTRRAGVNFRREYEQIKDVQDIEINRIEMIHPYWDMALLRVEGLDEEHPYLSLSARPLDDFEPREIEVAVIGYPAQDLRNDIELQNDIFSGVYNVKRLQPGKLDTRRQILSFGNQVDAVTHDASTLGGNSGSAVVDVSSGQVLALHFAGIYLDANFAVPAFELARDPRVVDSQVKFEGVITPGDPWADHWAIANSLSERSGVVSGSGGVTQHAPSAKSSTALNLQSNGGNQVSITIPLTITVSLGDPVASAVAAASSAETVGLEGLFSDDSAEILHTSYRRANVEHLDQSVFSLSAALTTAAASALVYSNNQDEMEQICRAEFGFDTCFFLQHSTTECFIASSPDTILVCFRGTQGIRDWIANMNIAEAATDFGMVHNGFLQGFLGIRPSVERVIDSAISDKKQLVLTGHSLGGALATIAASEWRNRFDIRSILTFGQPAVGDRAFRDSMERFRTRFHRVVNDDDIVAKIPPHYRHVGSRTRLPPMHQLDSIQIESLLGLETVSQEEMLSEVAFYHLQQQLDPQVEALALEGFVPSLSDHRIKNYLGKLLKLSNTA